MGALNYSAGGKVYDLPNGETVSFDPCNAEFASAVVRAFSNCHKIHQEGTKELPQDVDELYKATKKMAGDIRREIDAVFGDGVCDKACCGSSPISISDGLPVWMNFLMAVIDEIDANIPEGEKRSRARVQQYMDKYSTKYGKYVRK